MAPIFPLMLLAVFAMVWGLVCLGCCFLLVWGLRRGPRLFAWVGGGVPSATVLGILFLVFQDRIVPLDTQARSLMSLPAEARAVRVEHGDWGGDDTVSVYFRLSPTRTVSDWMQAVWRMNPDESPAPANKTRYRWERDFDSGDHRELEYDPRTGVYRYSVTLNS